MTLPSGTLRGDSSYTAGYRMIDHVSIRNFRRFKALALGDCSLINIVVGDNGAGKTALLEAIFLAVAYNPQKAVMLRQTRGLEGAFSGQMRAIEEALYAEIFYQMDPANSVEISLKGQGPECRELRIYRGRGDVEIPTDKPSELELLSPVLFEWTDADGAKHSARTRITASGIQFESTGESLPDFYFFQSQTTVPSIETATRFSNLSRQGDSDRIIDTIKRAFEWISWVGVESISGAPAVHASARGSRQRRPITTLSGAVNRFIAILVAVAQRPRGLVLVDEIENGVYYSRHAGVAQGILSAARQNSCQLFLTTHSNEWLRSLVEAAGPDVSDITLWRIEDAEDGIGTDVLRFSGDTLRAGIEYGAEVRGDASQKRSSSKGTKDTTRSRRRR